MWGRHHCTCGDLEEGPGAGEGDLPKKQVNGIF